MPRLEIPQNQTLQGGKISEKTDDSPDLDFTWELNESHHYKIRLFLLLTPGGLIFLSTILIMGLSEPKYHIVIAIGGFLLTLFGILKGGDLVGIYDKKYKEKRLKNLKL
jgi:hypothetical protein